MQRKSKTQRFLFGDTRFDEREEYLEFQYKFLVVLILAVVATVLFFLGALLLVERDVVPLRYLALVANIVVSLSVWLMLRGHKERFVAAAWTMEAVCFAVCTSALMLVPNDALRVVWLFVNVPCVYILLGQRAGAFVTACSILLLALGNPYFVAPYTGTELVGGIMGLGLLAFLFHIYRARSLSFYWRMQASKERLRNLATTDALTGLLNARAYHERCNQVLVSTRRRGAPWAVLFMDLDHFKSINDRHGHAAGDIVLQSVAQALAGGVRASDIVARIGGEEFSVFLPDTEPEGARVLAESLRAAVEALMPDIGPERLRVTASIGVASGLSAAHSVEDIQRMADQAMYEAKAQGRNRVTVFQRLAEAPASA